MIDESLRVMSDAEIEEAERLAEARLAEARAQPRDRALVARVDDYLRRPYWMEIRGTPEDGYLAIAPELPGCITAGGTPEEALRRLRDAMTGWIEAAIVADDPVPAPREAPGPASSQPTIDDLLATLGTEKLISERVQFLVEVEKALDTSNVQPGPDWEVRRMLRTMITLLARGEQWDPATDAPGSTAVAFANAYLRFIGSLPVEVRAETIKRFVGLLEAGSEGLLGSDSTRA